MWFWNILLVVHLFTFCNSYSLTNNLDDFALRQRFINGIQNFTSNNERRISVPCMRDLTEYKKALTEPEMWAWLMFDAGTKIPSGILSGNIVDLGQFDQCINIENQITNKNIIISGKYCLGSIPLTPETLNSRNSLKLKMLEIPQTRMLDPVGAVSIMFATCLPSSCESSDIQQLYSWIYKVEVHDALCQTKSSQPKLSGGDIATISFLSIILGIMLVSTTYDVFLFYGDKKSPHPLLIAFSILSNGKKLLSTTKSAAQISCLSGIRVISMMWVILGHRYLSDISLPTRNLSDVLKWFSEKKNMYVIGAPVAVDTFFLIGGLVVSYSFLMSMAKSGRFNIIQYYIHRYLRLTPILAVVILIYVTILKYLGSGPLWYSSVESLTTGCETHWWTALLYIQNYVNPENMCVGQSWYLSVDTQLFVLSPLLLLPLKKWPKIGLSATGILIFASILTSFLVAWFGELYGFMMANPIDRIDDYAYHYYFPTHTRAGPWFMGIILGYCVYEIKQNHRKIPMNKILALILWIISLSIMISCVYTGHETMHISYIYSRIANSLYVALLRPGWALAISWVIIACVTGYGGPVNWFLSLPIFQVVGKLTYSMYLVHKAMIMIVSSQMRTSAVFSPLQTLFIFWGDFAYTLATSIIFTLAFESPIIIIEKVISGTGQNKSSKERPPLENEKRIDVP